MAGHEKGSKIVKSVVLATISQELLSEFTWTGKSNKGEKKAFNSKKAIIEMLYNVIRAYDATYTRSTCTHDLKYKIFKYAYTG